MLYMFDIHPLRCILGYERDDERNEEHEAHETNNKEKRRQYNETNKLYQTQDQLQ